MRRSITTIALCLLLAACTTPADPCAELDCVGRCTTQGSEALCVCGPEEQAQGFDCKLDWPDADRDSAAHAVALEPAAITREARLGPTPAGSEDADFYAFDAVADHVYAFSCTGQGFGCRATLRDAHGAEVLSATGLAGEPATVARSLPAGRHVVELRASTAGQQGTYRYRLEDLGPDDHPNTPGEAATLPVVSGELRGQLEYAGDVDVVAVELTAGHVIDVGCTRAAPTDADFDARVVDAEGTTLATRDFESTTSGRAFLRISAARVKTGAYSCWLRDAGPEDHGDTAEDATPLPASLEASGTFELPEDVDAFSFVATAEHLYAAHCLQDGVTDCFAPLAAAAGDVACGVPEGTRVSVAAAARVEMPSAQGTGPFGYSLWIEDLGREDHGDTAETATALTPSTVVSGKLECGGDVDVFSFAVAAGQRFRLTLDGTGATGALAGVEWACDADPTQGCVAQTAGTGLARVTRVASGGDLTYQLRVDALE